MEFVSFITPTPYEHVPRARKIHSQAQQLTSPTTPKHINASTTKHKNS